ncbi:MAG: NAD(P)H-dependent oxidoreductase subunit E [Thermodesulfovibrionales bacterium]|nr:NAD(P)H-dependent oxidoreductase subunit E [Thermodesulfovibrionales bacterium]
MEIEEIDVDENIGEVGRVLREHERRRGILIHVLQEIEENNGYLPEGVLRRLSRKLDLPLAEIYSVASFYKMFHFTPRGRKVVKVCLGTACYVRGSKKVLTALEDEFGIKSGETTEDLALTLETVGCVGCCGLAPVTTVNDEVIGETGTKKLEALVRSIKKG